MAVDWMPYGLVESGELLTSEDSTKKKRSRNGEYKKMENGPRNFKKNTKNEI